MDWSTIILTIATALEAVALWPIYRLERNQVRSNKVVEISVEVDFPEGENTGALLVWIHNAAGGPAHIQDVWIRLEAKNPDEQVTYRCKLAGKRHLRGYEGVNVNTADGLRVMANRLAPYLPLSQQRTGWATVDIWLVAGTRWRSNAGTTVVEGPRYRAKLLLKEIPGELDHHLGELEPDLIIST